MSEMSLPLKLYHRRRNEYIKLLGGRCRNCGSVESLEFDHIDPSTKFFSITDGITRCYHLEVVLCEIEKCQLLCHNCHNAKSLAEQGGPTRHGTSTMYRQHSCRCEICKVGHKSRALSYYHRRMAENPNYRRELRQRARTL